MKTSSKLLIIGTLALTAALQSCEKHDYRENTMFANAMVTVRTGTEKLVLQLNDSTTLYGVNIKKSPYTKEVRAFTNIRKAKQEEIPPVWDEAQCVYVHWIDSILTKKTAPNLGKDNASTYGKDPVEIVDSWETVAEDGYLTLRFRTYWGGRDVHFVNLVTGTDPEDPYKVVFYHDSKADPRVNLGDGIVAFNLSELPDTEGKYVSLTLEWTSFNGTKTAKFKYKTRKTE